VKWVARSEQNLVAFLQGQLGNYSGKFVRKLLEANLCRINGKVERFGSKSISNGDAIELSSNWESLLKPKVTLPETLYEDDSLKIVSKPINWVCSDSQVEKTFGPHHYLVHRLDRDTTGLLILAKSISARDGLMELFKKREILKQYVTLVDGVPKEKEGMRQSYFMKKGSFQGQTTWGSGSKGQLAITRWQTMAAGQKASLILCTPQTGRTHQIRVHMMEMGHPILVDRQYSKNFRCSLFVSRPLLHAYRLKFSFFGKEIDVEAPLLVDICEAIRSVGIDLAHVRKFLSKDKHDNGWENSHDNKNREELKE